MVNGDIVNPSRPNFKHIPVLLDECLEALQLKKNMVVVDATLGGAGHSREIIKQISGGTLVGLDRDTAALQFSAKILAEAPNVEIRLVKCNFCDIAEVIPSLGINYPVLSEWSEDLLKVSVNKYWGPEPNEIGNYCIIGHNYRSGKMFGMLPAIANGDLIELTDTKYGRTVVYEVYDRYQIDPTDTKCTSQLTGGKREITLITCKEYGTQRLVVKAREVK